jgi:hypothetical protein
MLRASDSLMEQVHHNVEKEQEQFKKAKRLVYLFICLLIGFLIGSMYMKTTMVNNIYILPLWDQFTETTDIQIQKDLAAAKNELLDEYNCHGISYLWGLSDDNTPYKNGGFFCFFW